MPGRLDSLRRCRPHLRMTVGFTDQLRAWFKGDSKRTKRSKPKSTDDASRSSTKELDEFVRSRTGVEGFLEPKTAIYSNTLLLVADDGEYLRRPIKSRAQAGEFCGKSNIPLYDAAKVGYPQRMRDFEQGRRPRKIDLSELPPWPDDDLADGSTTDGPPPPPIEREVEPEDLPPQAPSPRPETPGDPSEPGFETSGPADEPPYDPAPPRGDDDDDRDDLDGGPRP